MLVTSGEVDAVVLSGYFGCYGADTPELLARELEVVESLAGAVTSHRRPVVVHSMSHDSEAVRSMRAQAVPTLHTIDAVARSLGLAASVAEHAGAPLGRPEAPDGEVGASADYLRGRELLASSGIRYLQALAVRSVDDVPQAVSRLEAPYVLKAGWIEHKTEVGGVAVGLADEAAVLAAFPEMYARLGEGGYVLEEMDRRHDTVELIVGARRDPSFGPVVMVGLGGVQAELYQDVQIALGAGGRGAGARPAARPAGLPAPRRLAGARARRPRRGRARGRLGVAPGRRATPRCSRPRSTRCGWAPRCCRGRRPGRPHRDRRPAHRR